MVRIAWGTMVAWASVYGLMASAGSAARPARKAEEYHLRVGSQRSLQIEGIRKMAVGNSAVADVRQLGAGVWMLTANKKGSTTLDIWRDGSARTHQVYVWNILPDEVKEMLRIIPGIEVRQVGTRIVVDGTAMASTDRQRIEKIAKMYPEDVLDLVTGTVPPELGKLTIQRLRQKIKDPKVQMEFVDNKLLLTGQVASESQRKYVAALAKAYWGEVIDSLQVSRELILARLKSEFGRHGADFEFINDRLVLKGQVAEEDDKKRILEAAKKLWPEVADAMRVAVPQVELDLAFVLLNDMTGHNLGGNPFAALAVGADYAGEYSRDRTLMHGMYAGASGATGADNSTAAGEAGAPAAFRHRTSIDRSLHRFIPTVRLGEGGAGVVYRYLQSRGLVNTLREPHLTTVSGKPARFTSGGEIAIRVAATGTTVGNVIFKEFGLIVEVTPTVQADGRVRMNLKFEVSSVTDYEANLSGDISFVKTSSEGSVICQIGETVVASGLKETVQRHAKDKTPLLGDVPLLEFVFASDDRSASATDIVLFVTPKVPTVRPAADPKPMSARFARMYEYAKKKPHFSKGGFRVQTVSHKK